MKLVVGELQENCFILFDENKDAFVVDPGGSSENIIEAIEKNNLKAYKAATIGASCQT